MRTISSADLMSSIARKRYLSFMPLLAKVPISYFSIAAGKLRESMVVPMRELLTAVT